MYSWTCNTCSILLFVMPYFGKPITPKNRVVVPTTAAAIRMDL